MNALAANDIEATDLLALARPDGDGPLWPAMVHPGGPGPDMIAAASGRARQQLMPTLTGVG